MAYCQKKDEHRFDGKGDNNMTKVATYDLIDEIQDPPSLVLKHFDDNLLNASNSKRVERSDIKFVAKNVLEALKAFHEVGYVHTDVKPDNILINYSDGPARFSEVGLGDCVDVYRVDLNADPNDMAKEDGHIIGAAIFRSPEAMLNLKWGTATDIWAKVEEFKGQNTELRVLLDSGYTNNFISRAALGKLNDVPEYTIPENLASKSVLLEEVIIVKKFVQLRLVLFEIDLHIEVDLKILETLEPKGTSFDVQRKSCSKACSASDGFGGSRSDRPHKYSLSLRGHFPDRY